MRRDPVLPRPAAQMYFFASLAPARRKPASGFLQSLRRAAYVQVPWRRDRFCGLTPDVVESLSRRLEQDIFKTAGFGKCSKKVSKKSKSAGLGILSRIFRRNLSSLNVKQDDARRRTYEKVMIFTGFSSSQYPVSPFCSHVCCLLLLLFCLCLLTHREMMQRTCCSSLTGVSCARLGSDANLDSGTPSFGQQFFASGAPQNPTASFPAPLSRESSTLSQGE